MQIHRNLQSSPGASRQSLERAAACRAVLGAAILLWAGSGACADDATEQVVVTATRTLQPRDRTGESVSIISADDLNDQQTVVLTDALAQTPGLTVVRTGGVGQPTTVSIRGAEAGQTLVLIDGIRINDPSAVDDEAILGDLLVNDISRIEILRGPQSTLYGSDAIGGVVNIITQRGGPTPVSLTGTAEGGSFDTFRLNAAANGNYDGLEYGIAANYYHSGGVSSADPRYAPAGPDSYRNFGATENARLDLAGNVSLDLRTYYTTSRDEFDDNFTFIPTPPYFRVAESPAYGTDQLLASYAGINFDFFGGRLQNRIAAIGSLSDRKTFPAPGQPDNFFARGDAGRFEYQGTLTIDADNEATFGAEYQHTSLTTHSIFDTTPVTKGHDDTEGYYAQWQSTLIDGLTVTGGGRYDHDEEFGGHVSVKLAGAWTLNDTGTVLHANFGDGFKAPTLYELDSEYSNPLTLLKPEVGQGWEVGLEQSVIDGRGRLSLTWFERNTENQIDFFTCFGPTSPACDKRYLVGGYYYNVGHTRARGVEAEATFALTDTLNAYLNYTNMTAVDVSTGADLARRPHVMTDARVFWTPVRAVSVGASIGYVGRRWDDAANTVPLDSNTLVNLYGSYTIAPALQLFGRIENVADIHYEPAFGYGASGRAYYAGIRATY